MSFEILVIIIACLLVLGIIGFVAALSYKVLREVTQDPLEDFIVICHGKVWEDHYPSINKLNQIRDEYPVVDKAYEQFKTAYNLVINDWESKRIEK